MLFRVVIAWLVPINTAAIPIATITIKLTMLFRVVIEKPFCTVINKKSFSLVV